MKKYVILAALLCCACSSTVGGKHGSVTVDDALSINNLKYNFGNGLNIKIK